MKEIDRCCLKYLAVMSENKFELTTLPGMEINFHFCSVELGRGALKADAMGKMRYSVKGHGA